MRQRQWGAAALQSGAGPVGGVLSSLLPAVGLSLSVAAWRSVGSGGEILSSAADCRDKVS